MTGKPIRPSDGHVALLRILLKWQEVWRKAPGECRIDFEWVLAAENMRQREGVLSCYFTPTNREVINYQLFEIGARYRATCEGGPQDIRFDGEWQVPEPHE